jgi:acetolactate synthase small subunit
MPIFVIHARRTPEAMSRVVLLFHRRRLEIDWLVAEYERESDVLRIEVKIAENEGRAEWIEANLCKLVDVLLVETKRADWDQRFHEKKDGQQER